MYIYVRMRAAANAPVCIMHKRLADKGLHSFHGLCGRS